MKLIGFNYTKISAHRLAKLGKVSKVAQNVKFSTLEKEDSLSTSMPLLRITFTYDLIYEPDNVVINLEGNVFVTLDEEMAKKVLQQWKKKKEVTDELRFFLLRIVLNKCGLKSLNLEEELGVPTHMKLVKINE